ncbi:TonB-dependent receptor plug domain-containing protein [Bacteroidota bacterium]
MKKICFFILSLLFLFEFPETVAQERAVIRGQVTEKSTGDPLPGVNIVEMDEQNRIVKGVITDVNGNYVFEVANSEHTIQVSFIGYSSPTFKIDSRDRINIALEMEALGLDEVTITAKGGGNTLTGVANRDRTSSSTRVDMERLSAMAGVSAESALQGQVSGLDIVAASGSPGSGSSIVIRGMGSLGNTNPLVVIDGIPQDIKTDEFNFAAADQHDLGQLLNIAPQDIKSVEVLKDAASTAVWGSKGANGVLLIETQTGSKGKIKFNYEYKLSANVQPPQIPLLNGDEYITMQLEQWHNAYGLYNIPDEIAYDINYIDFYNYSANTDWVKEVTRSSYSHNHFFKMQGGGE